MTPRYQLSPVRNLNQDYPDSIPHKVVVVANTTIIIRTNGEEYVSKLNFLLVVAGLVVILSL